MCPGGAAAELEASVEMLGGHLAAHMRLKNPEKEVREVIGMYQRPNVFDETVRAPIPPEVGELVLHATVSSITSEVFRRDAEKEDIYSIDDESPKDLSFAEFARMLFDADLHREQCDLPEGFEVHPVPKLFQRECCLHREAFEVFDCDR